MVSDNLESRERAALEREYEAAQADYAAGEDEYGDKLASRNEVQRSYDTLKDADRRFESNAATLGDALAASISNKPLIPPVAGTIILACIILGELIVSTERLDQLGLKDAVTQGIAFSTLSAGFAHIFGKATAALRFPEASRYDWFSSGIWLMATLITLTVIVRISTPPVSEAWPADERAQEMTYSISVYGLLVIAAAVFAHISTDAEPKRSQLRSLLKREKSKRSKLKKPLKDAETKLATATREVATVADTLTARGAALRQIEAKLQTLSSDDPDTPAGMAVQTPETPFLNGGAAAPLLVKGENK